MHYFFRLITYQILRQILGIQQPTKPLGLILKSITDQYISNIVEVEYWGIFKLYFSKVITDWISSIFLGGSA